MDGLDDHVSLGAVRSHLGFRECTVADADQLTPWPADAVCEAERRSDLVRDELLGRCRAERIEPPAAGRIVRSALHQGGQALTGRLAVRLPVEGPPGSGPWSRSRCRTTTQARSRCWALIKSGYLAPVLHSRSTI
ncbi:hypothetical protein Ate02nite_95410 [Paractinoplanes tereljensis]|uniref:Uncharacterized protein n=1 Tax=Paractinoplanes tereljensis TaxID=571912 RepID=A0A919TXW6_9ACTN|nr:hypothetical protein Ate02nite_95410 [Actinoplanes tereljensis]